jgi:hypothetical protein
MRKGSSDTRSEHGNAWGDFKRIRLRLDEPGAHGVKARMTDTADDRESPNSPRRPLTDAARRALAEAAERRARQDNEAGPRPAEESGPKGLEPTRYGDWERKGIASDF